MGDGTSGYNSEIIGGTHYDKVMRLYEPGDEDFVEVSHAGDDISDSFSSTAILWVSKMDLWVNNELIQEDSADSRNLPLSFPKGPLYDRTDFKRELKKANPYDKLQELQKEVESVDTTSHGTLENRVPTSTYRVSNSSALVYSGLIELGIAGYAAYQQNMGEGLLSELNPSLIALPAILGAISVSAAVFLFKSQDNPTSYNREY